MYLFLRLGLWLRILFHDYDLQWKKWLLNWLFQISVFDRHGFEIRIAGGAVRDLLSGQAPHDIDLVNNNPSFINLRIKGSSKFQNSKKKKKIPEKQTYQV
jgi:tRNA nucleotidyltransferase/poly(A) polymerase